MDQIFKSQLIEGLVFILITLLGVQRYKSSVNTSQDVLGRIL